MNRFLIDTNLPYYLSFWKGQNYTFVQDINKAMPDSEIWNFAKQENFVIVTKDADFSNRILFADPPPRVIHFRTGNLKLADFFHLCDLNWENIVKLSVDHKLIYVYRDRIDLIR